MDVILRGFIYSRLVKGIQKYLLGHTSSKNQLTRLKIYVNTATAFEIKILVDVHVTTHKVIDFFLQDLCIMVTVPNGIFYVVRMEWILFDSCSCHVTLWFFIGPFAIFPDFLFH